MASGGKDLESRCREVLTPTPLPLRLCCNDSGILPYVKQVGKDFHILFVKSEIVTQGLGLHGLRAEWPALRGDAKLWALGGEKCCENHGDQRDKER